MSSSAAEVLRDQGRGIVGALLLGTPLLLTMETWWRADRLPITVLITFALGGLVVVTAATRLAGFREAEEGAWDVSDWVSQLGELVLQSLVAALTILFLFGVWTFGDSLDTVVRLGLVQVVPLGLGAALANAVLAEAKGGEAERLGFPQNVATFSLGALLFALVIAPTVEMERLATMAGWWRLAAIVAVAVLIAYLVLYELAFRGQGKRTSGRRTVAHVGEAFMVYGTALGVSGLLLAGYGHFSTGPFEVWVAKSIVLAFPATVGGAIVQVGTR